MKNSDSFFVPEFIYSNDGCRKELVISTIWVGTEEDLKFLLDPRISSNFFNLLRIRSQYFSWNECNHDFNDEREWFMLKYLEKLKFFSEKGLIPGGYREFLYKLFDDMVDEHIKNNFNRIDMCFDGTPKKFNFKLSDVEDSTNIEFVDFEEFKNKLILFCRTMYPEASRNKDHILKSKTFMSKVKQMFIESFKEWLKVELEDEVKNCEDFLQPYILSFKKMLEDRIRNVLSEWSPSIHGEFLKPVVYSKLEKEKFLIENGDCMVFYEIECMLKLLNKLKNENGEKDIFLYKYLQAIFSATVDEFFKSEKIKLNTRKTTPKQGDRQSKPFDSSMQISTPVSSPIQKVTQEEWDIIGRIAQILNFGTKSAKEFTKYLTRLVANWKDIRMSVLKDQYWIDEVSDEVKSLFESLCVDIIDDCKLVEDMVIEEEEISNSDSWKDESIDNFDSEEPVDNPFDLLKSRLEKYNYKIKNEKKLLKQINSLCCDDKLKKILCYSIINEKFWEPKKINMSKKKNVGNFYSLRMGWNTGFRFFIVG